MAESGFNPPVVIQNAHPPNFNKWPRLHYNFLGRWLISNIKHYISVDHYRLSIMFSPQETQVI